MCAEPIADEHQHVVNIAARQLMCTCRGCYLLFSDPHAKLRYRAVPDRYLTSPTSRWTVAVGNRCRFRSGWRSSSTTPTWTRPSPSTQVRQAPPSLNWTSTPGAPSAAPTPGWGMLHDDVEALAGNACPIEITPIRNSTPQPSANLVPIDACYEFVGRLRMLWHGFDGGHEVREFVDEFFERIKARSKVAST